MSIKIIYKKTAVILLAMVVLLISFPLAVSAAPDIDIIYAANASANAGDTINVTISTTGGASISTLGLRLYYDINKLTYQGSQWAESLQNSNSSMTLVSDVAYSGSQVLNISMISDAGYQSGGTLITLTFSVKESYTESPFKLELREITDKNLQNLGSTTSISYQNTGNGAGEGTSSPGTETGSPETGTGSSNENTSSPENGTGSQAVSINNTKESVVNIPAVSSTDSVTAASVPNNADITNTSDITSSADTASTAASVNHPKTFQTGVEDFGSILLLIGTVFGLAGIICIVIRRKLSR